MCCRKMNSVVCLLPMSHPGGIRVCIRCMVARKVQTLLLNTKVNLLAVFFGSRKELSIAAGATDVFLFQE